MSTTLPLLYLPGLHPLKVFFSRILLDDQRIPFMIIDQNIMASVALSTILSERAVTWDSLQMGHWVSVILPTSHRTKDV